jgi:hypothetical protein
MRRWKTKHYLISALGVLLVFVGWQLFRGGEQAFANDDERFNYGSLGAELVAGIPYPIFRTLPQLFPDLLARHASPGAGTDNSGRTGYEAFGLAVEADQALPIGFSIKRLGVERVTVNCALCHTTAYRLAPDEAPRYARGGPGHTANIQGLLRFLFAAARDPTLQRRRDAAGD